MIQDAVEILLFVICVLLSAFFSSSEVALISITRAKARTFVNEGKPGSKAVAALKESPEHCSSRSLSETPLSTSLLHPSQLQWR